MSLRVTSRRCLVGAAIAGAGVGLVAATSARADGQTPALTYRILPEERPLPATPRVIVSATGVPRAAYPVSIQLDVARTRNIGGIFFSATQPGDTVTFVTRALFPENDSVFMRFTLRDRDGRMISERIAGFRTAPRLTLYAPAGALGVVLTDARPVFIWGAARVEVPPGPWVYQLTVINAATGVPAFVPGKLVDTVFRPAVPLEANTPYRWSVRAFFEGGPDTASRTVTSQSTFVITSEFAPTVTLLYQNFPNPFPNGTSDRTCIWFDLHQRARVSLQILDLRGNRVRTLLANESRSAGAYGRGGEGPNAGCGEFSWDGTASDGHAMPAGVYLLYFRADNAETVRKMLFRGR